MINRPRLTRASAAAISMTWPATWMPADRPVGGGERSAAGIPSNYVIRTEPLLIVTLRITETEWPSIVTFLRAVDASGEAWTFHPDTDVATTLTVYLESPSVASGETFTPRRDDGDGSLFLLDITLRRSSETVIDVPLYG